MTYYKPLASAYNGDSELYETCVWIGCEAAKGKTNDLDVFNAIWNKFQTMSVCSKDGRVIGYYSTNRTTDNTINHTLITLDYLLRYNDGRCGAWADFFENVLACQGISSSQLEFSIKDSEVIYFLNTKNIFPNRIKTILQQNLNSFPGNGSPNLFGFSDHVINIFNNFLYDATCGVGDYYNSTSGFQQYLQQNVSIKCYEVDDENNENLIYTISGNEIDTTLFYNNGGL
ncbi:MAG: hypothetical protein IJS60_09925 [Abditibacteriota bacterium]|nr:hypothetical protein [Abditibacteriota bacterium]